MVCFCKTKETNGETKSVKANNCVNSEWLREKIGIGPRKVGKFLNFQIFQIIAKDYSGR